VHLTANKTGHYRGLLIDQERFEASVHGLALDLTPVEFRMLSLLGSVPGRVYSRDQLLSTIYLDGRIVGDRTVDSHVKNLRKKLRTSFGEEEVIHSIYGVGYKFE
jgi:two-component system response regulator BaeR